MCSELVPKVLELLKSHKFLQFSASWCPDCRYANSVWRKLGIENKIYIFDIACFPRSAQEQWRSAFQQATGSRNLPSIYCNGNLWGTESQLHAFEKKGTLQDELRKVGLL
ncbi:glutathione-disulfide reductase grx8 [Zygosaccharomyces mellis]|uniref:Glutathione-disulfide reductase grx8 n=1 Tax=Zygosaccharomyces mellis TaxID=42258 RepID=A0A4C2DZD2_9SACH|nr:glutathione-disulfide reductase grx8 [Zygosaccharomyces mellis]